MSYVDAALLRDYLRSSIAADEAEIDASQLAAESGIDTYCQRTFIAAAGTSTKTYLGNGSDVLAIDDFVTVSQVVDAGGTLTASEFDVGGWTDTSGRDWPLSQIRRVDGTPWTSVSIVASWGWPATPPEIPIAVRLLVRDSLLSRDMAYGIVQVGEYSRKIAENGVVAMLLDPLRRPEALPVA